MQGGENYLFIFFYREELLCLSNGYTLLQDFVSDPLIEFMNAALGDHNDRFVYNCSFVKSIKGIDKVPKSSADCLIINLLVPVYSDFLVMSID